MGGLLEPEFNTHYRKGAQEKECEVRLGSEGLKMKKNIKNTLGRWHYWACPENFPPSDSLGALQQPVRVGKQAGKASFQNFSLSERNG